MRLVHLADTHLGFRRHQRLTPGGMNQREADVATAFKRAVDQVIALAPDLVLVAGDVFHVVRPSNPAIIHAYAQFARLRASLPAAEVVVIAGNHDIPRASETGCILRLFSQLGVHVADRTAARFDFPALDCAVLAVPEDDRPALTPLPGRRHNVLLLHGEVEGILPHAGAGEDRATVPWRADELTAGGWSYVALGHYHVYRQVAPNAWYAGALEYASADPWGELREAREAGLPGKGFIEHDCATGAHTFHPVPPPRAVVDLPALDGRGRTAKELDAMIAAAVERCPGGLDDAVVRLVVREVPRHVARDLEAKPLREYKRRALHFQLELRRPDPLRQAPGEGAPGRMRRRALEDVLAEALAARALDPGVDRDALVRLGLAYLARVDAPEGGAVPAAGEAG